MQKKCAQVPIFIGWTIFLLLLLCYCICLYYIGIFPTLEQIRCRFCCLIIFLGSISTPNLILLCFCRKLQMSEFIGWASFMMLLGHVCFWLSCLHVLCGPWSMWCVLVTRFSIFWVMHVNTYILLLNRPNYWTMFDLTRTQFARHICFGVLVGSYRTEY